MATFVRLPFFALRSTDSEDQTKFAFFNPDTVRCVCESDDSRHYAVLFFLGSPVPRFCPLSPEAVVARLSGAIPSRQPLSYELAMMKPGDHARDSKWQRWTLVRQFEDRGETRFCFRDLKGNRGTFSEDGTLVYVLGEPTEPFPLCEVEIPRS